MSAQAKELSLADALAGKTLDDVEDEDPTVQEELRALRAEVSSLKEQLAPKQVRSKMSNKEKVEYIGKHGASAYLKIPWD